MSHCCKIYSMIISFLDIFKIDRLEKEYFAKVIFTFALLAGVSVYFFPLGDTDFTRLILMMQSMMTDMDAFMNAPVYEIPLSTRKYYLSSSCDRFLYRTYHVCDPLQCRVCKAVQDRA